MLADINRWMIENQYLIPLFFVGLLIALHQEKRRIHQRMDAIIELLRRRGIDIHDNG